MTAAAADRQAPRLGQQNRMGRGSLAASTTIYNGTLVARNPSGYLVPAANTAGLRVVGCALHKADNSTGAAGAVDLEYGIGVFGFKNDATDAIALAHTGYACVVKDDQTVANSVNGGFVTAGLVEYFDSAESLVYVNVGDSAMMHLLVNGSETVDLDGALSIYKTVSVLDVDGTQAFTLPDGLFIGQKKWITCSDASSTPVGVVTPATLIGGSTLTFNAVTDAILLEWQGGGAAGGWGIIYNVSVALA